MSEQTADRSTPRRQAIPQKEYQSQISRRNLLIKGATVVATTIAGAVGLDIVRTRTAEEPKIDEKVQSIHHGGVEFTNEVNFRTAATIGADLIGMPHIVEVYGTPVENPASFTVENIPVGDGKNPDPTDKNRQGDWFAIKAKYRDGVGFIHSGFLYASRSYLTAGAVNSAEGGRNLKVTQFNKDTFSFIMEDGKPFSERVGIVSLPPKKAA